MPSSLTIDSCRRRNKQRRGWRTETASFRVTTTGSCTVISKSGFEPATARTRTRVRWAARPGRAPAPARASVRVRAATAASSPTPGTASTGGGRASSLGRYRRAPHVSAATEPAGAAGIWSTAAEPAATVPTTAFSAAISLSAAADARAGLCTAARAPASALPALPGTAGACRTITGIRCATLYPRPRTRAVPASCVGPQTVIRRADRAGDHPGCRYRGHRCRDRLAGEHPFSASGGGHRRTHHHENDIRRGIDHANDNVVSGIDHANDNVAERSACAYWRAGAQWQPDIADGRYG